jgi:hypothetical protein
MDLDPCEKAPHMGYEPADEKELMLPEPVADPVKPDSMESGVTENNLQDASCRGVTVENRFDVVFKSQEHGFSSFSGTILMSLS